MSHRAAQQIPTRMEKRMPPIQLYSMDQKLRVIEQGPIDYKGALRVIDAYIQQHKGRWETGEEMISNTMFGFSLDKDTFIEIAVVDPGVFDVRSETSIPRSFLFLKWLDWHQREVRIHGEDELKRVVKLFFENTPEAFRAHFESLPGRI